MTFTSEAFTSLFLSLLNAVSDSSAHTMNTSRSLLRLAGRQRLPQSVAVRPFTLSLAARSKDQEERIHPNTDGYREDQKSKPVNPHMTNTASTFHEEMPSVGEDKPPPEFLSSVDPNYQPKDKKPENTERMTGGQQPGDPSKVSSSELGVGEMEGAAFKVEPLRRTGEDAPTMRARLLCPS